MNFDPEWSLWSWSSKYFLHPSTCQWLQIREFREHKTWRNSMFQYASLRTSEGYYDRKYYPVWKYRTSKVHFTLVCCIHQETHQRVGNPLHFWYTCVYSYSDSRSYYCLQCFRRYSWMARSIMQASSDCIISMVMSGTQATLSTQTHHQHWF